VSDFHWPWPVLGIAPTDDRKTIREAYARLLKALDPDAATEAFMELRDARDAALSGHFLHPPRAEDEEEDDFGLGTPLPEGSEAPETSPPADEPGAPEERAVFTVAYSDDDDRRFQRVVDLLLGEEPLTAADNDEINRHLDTLFADDRMADLGHYARIETWLAQLLAERFPRGAPFFPRIAEHFQWGERAHELGIHPAIPWLFNSHESHSLVGELETPGHAYHREWVELARGKPKGPLWLRSINKARMANLIGTIRRDYPWLEQEHWQPDLVVRWEKKVEKLGVGGGRGSDYWIWIFVAAIFFVILPRMLDGGTTPPRQQAVETPTAADELAADAKLLGHLQSRFPQAEADGRTLATLREKSPEAYRKLREVVRPFDPGSEHGDRLMMREITEIYYYIIDKLPYKLQVADARFRAATLRKLQKNPDACAEFMDNPRNYLRQGNSAGLIEPDYQYQMFSVVHDEYDAREWPLVRKDFTISGDIVGKVLDRSGLPEKRLRAAIETNDAPTADRCRAMRSLYEVMTETPQKEASKVLPALM